MLIKALTPCISQSENNGSMFPFVRCSHNQLKDRPKGQMRALGHSKQQESNISRLWSESGDQKSPIPL